MGTRINRPRVDLDLMPPIGSVLAWVKSFPNTPALPSGWVECNGQVLDDAESVYNGETIPDLNVADRFLRGNATSGGTGGATTINISHFHTQPAHDHYVSDSGNTGYESSHRHEFSGETGTSTQDAIEIMAWDSYPKNHNLHTHPFSGTSESGMQHRHTFSMSDTSSDDGDENTGNSLSSTQSILPPYYRVVWIMRVR